MTRYTDIRKVNILTGTQTMQPLASLKQFPVFIGCTDVEQSTDQLADMEFDICTQTGLIQLRRPLDPSVIYSGYHSEALGATWQAHHKQFASFVQAYQPKKVLEIGGSSGAIANLVIEKNPEVHWTIIEPNPAPVTLPKQCSIVKTFFDDSFSSTEQYDAVVHSHTLEHLYDPMPALRKVNTLLQPGGMHIFSVPNLLHWLSQRFPNALNFEHTIFLTEEFIEAMLAAAGFRVIKKEYFEKHSIFFAAEKISDRYQPVNLKNHYAEYKKLFEGLLSYYKNEAAQLNQALEALPEPRYLFGAHIFSQYFVYFGLKEKLLSGILDNSIQKQGKRLYGTGLQVRGPSEVVSAVAPSVIVRAGIYTDEIIKQLKGLNKMVTIL